MNEKLIAVTPPDDVLQDAGRLLLVDLTEEQMSVVSKALGEIDEFNRIVLYIWKQNDDIEWLLDKKLKSDLIVFNADSFDQTLIGYLAAQTNSCYFGILKSIGKVNDTSINDLTQLVNILERKLT
jgi:hypothetical protein